MNIVDAKMNIFVGVQTDTGFFRVIPSGEVLFFKESLGKWVDCKPHIDKEHYSQIRNMGLDLISETC